MNERDKAIALLEKLARKARMALHYASKNSGSETETANLKYKAEMLEWAVGYIQLLEGKVPKWISVEERLPEKHRRVLAACCMGVFEMTHDGAFWRMDEFGFFDTVTHWMPLPEPPVEE